ncbi:molybdenum cofactor guanylyltransferase MobA [Roseomonas elaeocarpi]|uniref:Molybdenum cofactor guanylyltransferase n=1 Tax=Roseomonas elaeocarpi TaxID=907779 RepID=A0ABV6JY42_9PROT
MSGETDWAGQTLGVILAGGLARRMGGGDKPLRPLGQGTMLDQVVARLRPQVAELVLNANGDPQRFASSKLPVVADRMADHPGPLAGVAAALHWAAENRPALRWVATVPGDTPFLPMDFVARLHAARLRAGTVLACAATAGRTHPPAALWPVALRDDLEFALRAGERKIDRWTARHGCASASWDDGGADPFFNANTPEELHEAEQRLLANTERR